MTINDINQIEMHDLVQNKGGLSGKVEGVNDTTGIIFVNFGTGPVACTPEEIELVWRYEDLRLEEQMSYDPNDDTLQCHR